MPLLTLPLPPRLMSKAGLMQRLLPFSGWTDDQSSSSYLYHSVSQPGHLIASLYQCSLKHSA